MQLTFNPFTGNFDYVSVEPVYWEINEYGHVETLNNRSIATNSSFFAFDLTVDDIPDEDASRFYYSDNYGARMFAYGWGGSSTYKDLNMGRLDSFLMRGSDSAFVMSRVDNQKLIMGAGEDFQMYFSGAHQVYKTSDESQIHKFINNLEAQNRFRALAHNTSNDKFTSGSGFEIFYSSNANYGSLFAIERPSGSLLPIRFEGSKQDFWVGNDLTDDYIAMSLGNNEINFYDRVLVEDVSGTPGTAAALLNLRDTTSNIGFQMGADDDGGWIRAVDVGVSVNADLILQPNGTKTITGGELESNDKFTLNTSTSVFTITDYGTSSTKLNTEGTMGYTAESNHRWFRNTTQNMALIQATNPYIDLGTTVLTPLSTAFSPNFRVAANTNDIAGFDFKNFNTTGQVRFMMRDDNDSYMVMGAVNSAGTTGNWFGTPRRDGFWLWSYDTDVGDKILGLGTISEGNLLLGTNNTERANFDGTTGDFSLVLDNQKLFMGASQDYSQWFDGTDEQFSSAGLFNFDSTIVAPDFKFTDGETMSWNSSDLTVDIPTGEGAVLQVGQESHLPRSLGKNDSGSLIENGKIVYLCENNGEVCIREANSREHTVVEKTVGITTQDIADGEIGTITTYGLVRGLDTSSWEVGETLYVSAVTDGELTNVRPTNGDWVIPIAEVVVKDAVDGELFIKYLQVFDPNDLKSATGFPNQNAFVKDNDASFVNSTRTFSLTPTVDYFYVWQLGVKYNFDSAVSVVIPDEEGLYYIYLDEGVMQYTKNPTAGEADVLIREKVLCAALYWNATDGEAVIIGDERHGHNMSSDTHAWGHYSFGAQWISGLAVSDLDVDQNGNDDAHAQFGIEGGVTLDEDLINISRGTASTVGLPIMYLDGADGNLRRMTRAGFSVNTFDGTNTTRLAYNEWTGTEWTITEVANNDYVLCHLFATNSKQDPVIAFMGQNDYATRGAARAGANTEMSTIITKYPAPELVPLATIIYQTGNTKTNAVKGETVSTEEGDDYVDWRQSELQPGAAPTDHGNLSGLANDDHTQYVLADGTRAFTGTVSGITPTSDSHLATKAYVDERVGFTARNSNTSMSATTFARVVFQTEEEDTNDAWNGSVFTVPTGQAGLYEIYGHATFTSITNGNRGIVGVELNGSLTNGGLLGRGANGATQLGGFGAAIRLFLDEGDQIEMVVYCDNATSLYNINQKGYTTFSAYKITGGQ